MMYSCPRLTRAACLGVWLGLAPATDARAQPADPATPTVGIATSFEQLRVITRPGARVTVTDASGDQLSGRIAELSSSSMSIIANGTRRDFGEGDIAHIRVRRGDPLDNGALWGLAIGAGFGAFVVSACDCTDRAEWMLLASTIYGGLGAGLGVGIDAAIRGEHLIYQARATSPGRVRVEPWIARRGVGISLSLGF